MITDSQKSKEKQQWLSYAWLFAGAFLMYFSNWNWALPAATWLFSVFLLRFSRTQKLGSGLLILCLISIIIGIVSMWQLLSIDAIPPSFYSGADVNQSGKGTFGMTFPLHEAIYMSSFIFNSKKKKDTSYAEQILQRLIKQGAYVASENEDGLTPLHVAAERNHMFAAQLLLKAGTKVMPKDESGKTPLDYAKSSDMISLLKKHGAKEN